MGAANFVRDRSDHAQLTFGGNSFLPIARIVDGINQDGIPGAIVYFDSATGSSTFLTDFGDLHQFNIAFDRASLGQMPYSGALDMIDVVWLGDDQGDENVEHSLAAWQAAEALRLSDWQLTGVDGGARSAVRDSGRDDPNPPPTLAPEFVGKKRNGIGLIYGMRMFDREEWQTFSAHGGILGSTRSETTASNQIAGPAAGLVWIKTSGRWTARLQGLASIGFNSGSVEQNSSFGVELVPGATNRLLYAQPLNSAHHDSFDEFSPSGELRAELNYRITESVTLAINWSGVTVENALEVENRMRYYAPDFGLVDPGNQRLLVHNVFCGVEMMR